MEAGKAGLPVGPVGIGGGDDAGFGAEIVVIEWLGEKANLAFLCFEIVENEFGVFGKFEAFVEPELVGFDSLGVKDFVINGVDGGAFEEKPKNERSARLACRLDRRVKANGSFLMSGEVAVEIWRGGEGGTGEAD